MCSENAWQLELEFGQNEFSIEVLAPALAGAQVSHAACGDLLITSSLNTLEHILQGQRDPQHSFLQKASGSAAPLLTPGAVLSKRRPVFLML